MPRCQPAAEPSPCAPARSLEEARLRRAVTVSAARPFNSCPNGHKTSRRENQGGSREMGIGVSLILIAAGAILTWAVNASVSGVDINTIGVILMVVGAIGLILSVMFWSTWGGVGGTRRRTTVVDDGPGY